MAGRVTLNHEIQVRALVTQHFDKLSAYSSNMFNIDYFVYILLCDQKTYYVGVTSDIKKRLFEHQNKLSIFTKQFSDIKLLYSEKYPTLTNARRREKQLKGWSHAKKKAIIENNKTLLANLSKSTEVVEAL